jgi:cytoskeletal protein CcmA (bactofilin family)
MFGSNKPPKAQSRIDSLIGAGTRVEGNVIFAGGLRIDGEVRGNVLVDKGQAGTLVISEQARVEGEISVSHLVINGTVIGPVHVAEFLELQPSARVTGDVEYLGLEMQQGAVVQGRLIHSANPQPDSSPAKTVDIKKAVAGA